MRVDFKYNSGLHFIFNTHGTDSDLCVRDGQKCAILRRLTKKEADMFEVGPMYKIRFLDGFETDAFEDELII